MKKLKQKMAQRVGLTSPSDVEKDSLVCIRFWDTLLLLLCLSGFWELKSRAKAKTNVPKMAPLQ